MERQITPIATDHTDIATSVFRICWSRLKRRFLDREDDAQQQLHMFILEKLAALPPGTRPSKSLVIMDVTRKMAEWGVRDTRAAAMCAGETGDDTTLGDLIPEARVAEQLRVSNLRRDVIEAINHLPEKKRRFIRQVYILGRSEREVRNVLGISAATYKRRLGFARAALLQLLSEAGGREHLPTDRVCQQPKLPPERYAEICRLRKDGWSTWQLAAHFGLDQRTIRRHLQEK